MRTIPPLLLAMLHSDELTSALLWRVDKTNGDVIRGTTHDSDITIDPSGDSPTENEAGTYLARTNITGSQVRSTSDLAVDNMEVAGAIPEDEGTTIDVSVFDIEAGLLDYAPVTLYLCNWRSPQDGVMVIKRGTLGELVRNSDYRYTTELRGLAQAYAQSFVRTYSERCQVRNFGDTECGVDVLALTQTGAVTSVVSRRRFNAALTGGQPAGYFSLGIVTFTTGANAGYSREVRLDDEDAVAGHISTWDLFPAEIEVGDAFSIEPGCDRRASTCKDKYDNILNFRGYGVYVEGLDALMMGPL